MSTLIGREVELAHAAAWLEEASQARGSVLLLSGEPGIGKTALATAIAAEAMARGFVVSVGRALEMSSAPPWLPLRPCLRAIGIARGLLPSAEHEVYGLWEEVLAALSNAAQRAPLLWVIEDLHAADLQTLDLLSFLAHPLRALKAAVLLTARSVDVLASDAVAERLLRLGRAGEVLELSALDEQSARALVQKAAARGLSEARITELVAHSKGHPLFALELARASGNQLPPSVLHVVQARLAALPAATRSALEHAAVLGPEVTAATLGRLVCRLPAAVIDDLLPALRARLIEELAPGRFRFAHALVRDAIHAALPAAQRCTAHAAAERVLAERGDSRDALVLRADHALQAQDAIEEARADDVVRRAVQSLAAEGAYDRAFALLRRWLEMRAAQPEAAIVLEAARLASSAGLHAESTRLAYEVIARGRAADDSALLGEAVLVLGATLRPGIVDRALARELEHALARLEADPAADRGLRCRVRARLAAALQPAGDPSVPSGMARAAIEEARALTEPRVLREVLFVASAALIDFVDPSELHALAVELSASARAAGDEPLLLRAEVRRIVHGLQLGELERLGADVDRLLRLAEGVGHPIHVWRAYLMASMRALARGEFAESARYLGEVEELLKITDDPALALGRDAHAAARAVALDEPDAMHAARAVYERIASGDVGGTTRAMLCLHIAVRLEDAAAAARELEWLTPSALGRELTEGDSFLLAVVCEAAALTGARARLAQLVPLLERARARMVVSGQVDFLFCGPLERVLGLAQVALGELERAETSLRSARERCEAHGLRPWVARIELELARVQEARGLRELARASALSALRQAEALPLPATAARACALLDTFASASTAARARAEPAPGRAPRPVPVELSPEGELWRVHYMGREIFVKDSRGLQLLARLVSKPGARVHVLALASDEGAALVESDGGSALDAAALRAYRARLAELDDTIAEAEGMEDGARAEQLQAEREAITTELKRAVGLGGRLRKVGSLTERARINVTRRLRDAIARISEADAELGRHLSDAVRTGTHCDYRP